MYDAAPARPRKTDIIRTRAGCVQCRRKKRKCDEEKPQCRRCVKGLTACEYSTAVEFRDVSAWAAEKVNEAKSQPMAKKTEVVKSYSRRPAGSASSPSTDVSAGSAEDHSEVSTSYLSSGTALATVPQSWGQGPATPSTEMHSLEVWASVTSGDSSPILDWAGSETASLSWFQDSEQTAYESTHASLLPPTPIVQEGYSSASDNFAFNTLFSSQTRPFRLPQTHAPSPLATNRPEEDVPSGLVGMQLEHARGQDSGNRHLHRATSMMQRTWSPPPVNRHRQTPKTRVTSSNRIVKPGRAATHPILPRCLSTARDIALGDRIYLAHSTLHMADLLPPQLRYLGHVAANAEPMRLALLGLAAANMANLHGAQERNRDGRSRWIPKDSHLRQASKLSSQALQLFSTESLLSRPLRLGMAVLLSYYQLELGTINDLFCSMRRLEAMILDILNDCCPVQEEIGILQAWSYLRTFCKRIYPLHIPYGIESKTESLLDTLQERVASPPHLVDLIRVDALHLTYRLLLYKCMRGHSSSSKETLRNISTWWAIVKGTTDQPSAQFCEEDFDTVLCEEDVHAALVGLADKLQGCDVPRELPVDFGSSFDHNALPASSYLDAIDASPVLFSTHGRAMKCIDYAFAQIVCDVRLLERAMGPRPAAWDEAGKSSPVASNPWLALILRIAAGIDPAECVRRNTYRTGVIGQIMRAALLCGEPAALEYLDRLLQRMLASCACYEDILTPLHLSYIANKALIKEFALGRHVFFGGVTYHQWTSKDVVFSRGEGEYFIICGRERDGRYFNDCVPLIST